MSAKYERRWQALIVYAHQSLVADDQSTPSTNEFLKALENVSLCRCMCWLSSSLSALPFSSYYLLLARMQLIDTPEPNRLDFSGVGGDMMDAPAAAAADMMDAPAAAAAADMMALEDAINNAMLPPLPPPQQQLHQQQLHQLNPSQPVTIEEARDMIDMGIPVSSFRYLPVPNPKNTAHTQIAAVATLKVLRVLHARYFPHVPLIDAFKFLSASQPAVCIGMKDSGKRCCTLSKASTFFCGHHMKSAVGNDYSQCVSDMASGFFTMHDGDDV